MERMLLAAALRDRASFDLISSYITLKKYSRPFQIVWDYIKQYYQRDEEAQSVVPELLTAYIAETTRNEKHVREFSDMIQEAWAADTSDANVKQVILESKKGELADELATALVNRTEHRDVLEKFLEIEKVTALDEINERGVEVFDASNMLDVLANESKREHLLTVYPRAINDRLDGGVAPGDHILVYARPETGKTALCISIAAGFARQGALGIYFTNEDRPQKILYRLMSNLIGWTRHQIDDDLDTAWNLALEAGIGNVRIVSLAPGNPQNIEACIEKYQPRWVVIDQLRNIEMRSDNRAVQLEMAANFGRKIAKLYNLVVVSVAQAGDSADGKEILTMGDVDWSNTGIPAQMDLMIGMGVTPALEEAGIRMISLPKNKIGGDHSNFAVRINQFLSRVTSPE